MPENLTVRVIRNIKCNASCLVQFQQQEVNKTHWVKNRLDFLNSFNNLKCYGYQEQRKDLLSENCLKRWTYNLAKSEERVKNPKSGRVDHGLYHVVPYTQRVFPQAPNGFHTVAFDIWRSLLREIIPFFWRKQDAGPRSAPPLLLESQREKMESSVLTAGSISRKACRYSKATWILQRQEVNFLLVV